MLSLAPDLVERVLSRHPVPIADAMAALVASASAHETRDRVVECFRAILRFAGALALAARVQYGPGPGAARARATANKGTQSVDRSGAIPVASVDRPEVLALLRSLRSRGLTDGQWVGLCRGLLQPWAGAAAAHPLPTLVELFHGSRRGKCARAVDGLLAMRKAETVAHGATGGADAIREVLARRVPQLGTLLRLFEPLWEQARLVLPVVESAGEAASESAGDPAGDPASDPVGAALAGEPSAEPPTAIDALLLMGYTSGHGRWRRVTLSKAAGMAPDQPLLIDPDGRPLLALAPVALVLQPSPQSAREVFLLDGARRRRAVYVAIPSMAVHYDADAWRALDQRLAADEPQEEGEQSERASSRPYRGLASFESRHAELFFGRDREIETLSNRIRQNGMVTVTGASGSGKTSLLHAGVLPTLAGFEIVVMRPGGAPMDALQQRMATLLAGSAETPNEPASDEPLADEPLAFMRRSDGSLAELCRARRMRLLVCVDQAEELFTLCRDDAQRSQFAGLLARSTAADADGPVRVVLSIRGDFFAHLAALPELAGLYSRNVEVVTTPDRDALVEILASPAREFGYQFEDHKLMAAMLEPLSGEPAALAMLQFAADRMWELRDRQWKRLTWDAYDAVGGVAGALAGHADAVLERMTASQRECARTLLLRLVTADGTREVADRRALLDIAGADASTVLNRLVDARLVVVHEAEGQSQDQQPAARVELIHEALLTRWDRLREWLDDDLEYLRIRDRVATAATHWIAERTASDYLLAEGKPLAEAEALLAARREILERNEVEFIEASRRRRSRRRLWARLAVAFVLAIATTAGLAGLYAWSEGRRATRESRRAALEIRQRQSAQDRAVRANMLARASEAAALASAEEADAKANEALLARARADLERDPTASLAWLQLLDPETESQRERTFREARLIAATAREYGVAEHVWVGHESAVTKLAFRGDGRAFASGSEDGAIFLWDPDTGQRQTLPGHGDQILDLAFSPDGTYLASVGADATARLTRSDGSETVELSGHTDSVTSLAFAPHGDRLATGGRDRAVMLWDLDALAAPLERFADFDGAITDLAISGNGVFLAAATAEGDIRLWDQATGESSELTGHSERVEAIGFSPDSRQLASVSRDRTVRIWDLGTAESQVLGQHERPARVVAFTVDGDRLLTSGADESAHLWSLQGAPDQVLRGHVGTVNDASFALGDGRVVSVGNDKTVRVWTVSDHGVTPVPRVLRGHKDIVDALAVAPDGTAVITGDRDGEIRLWRLRTADQVLTGPRDIITSVALSSKRTTIAAASGDGAIAIWRRQEDRAAGRWAAHRPETGFQGHQGMIKYVSIAPGDQTLATAGDDGTVRTWDLSSGSQLTVHKHDGPVWHVSFSPSGERLASASDDGTARVWDLASGRGTTLRGHSKAVVHVAFSPDGRYLATASWDGSARLWDGLTGRTVRVLGQHGDAVVRVVFSPDGRYLASGSHDRSARLYALDGTPLARLRGHTGEIHDLAFSADGSYLATAAADRTVRVWRVGAADDVDDPDDPDDPEQRDDVGEPDGTGGLDSTAAALVLRGHQDEVVSLAFAGDSLALVTASLDHTVRRWELELDGKGRTLTGHSGEVNQVVMSADGRLMVASSDDRSVRLWSDPLPHEPEALLGWLQAASRARWDDSGKLHTVAAP